MTPIRRLTLAALVALFMALGTVAPISATSRPSTPDGCGWVLGEYQCKEV